MRTAAFVKENLLFLHNMRAANSDHGPFRVGTRGFMEAEARPGAPYGSRGHPPLFAKLFLAVMFPLGR